MSLQEFLNQNTIDNIEKEVAISNRLKNEKGELYKFKIKPILEKEIGEIRKKYTSTNKKGIINIDESKITIELLTKCVLEPKFNDAESLSQLGCVTSEQYINKVLLPGEIERLKKEILEISGFTEDMESLVEDVKN